MWGTCSIHQARACRIPRRDGTFTNRSRPPPHLPCLPRARQSAMHHQPAVAATSSPHPMAHASRLRILLASSGSPAWPSGGLARLRRLEGNDLATAGQGNGIVEGAGPGRSGQFAGAQALTYVKSTSINLMAGIPSYFSGSNPYLSNLRLAARSTCDLN
jgi:hypothetical protein